MFHFRNNRGCDQTGSWSGNNESWRDGGGNGPLCPAEAPLLVCCHSEFQLHMVRSNSLWLAEGTQVLGDRDSRAVLLVSDPSEDAHWSRLNVKDDVHLTVQPEVLHWRVSWCDVKSFYLNVPVYHMQTKHNVTGKGQERKSHINQIHSLIPIDICHVCAIYPGFKVDRCHQGVSVSVYKHTDWVSVDLMSFVLVKHWTQSSQRVSVIHSLHLSVFKCFLLWNNIF